MGRGRVDDSTPEAHYTRTIYGSGRLISGDLSLEVSGFTLERGEYSHNAEWAFNGLVKGDNRALSDVIFARAGAVHFEGVTAYGVAVRAEDVRGREVRG